MKNLKGFILGVLCTLFIGLAIYGALVIAQPKTSEIFTIGYEDHENTYSYYITKFEDGDVTCYIGTHRGGPTLTPTALSCVK